MTLLEKCLERIALLEPDVLAWVEVNPRPATGDGLLNGVPFGAKDIFETAGLATEYGSPLYAGRKGSQDARVIADLRRAGAILVGKTQTTAFASFDPAPTRNPRLPGHTPGGSSSGSAAAVAAGMVPFALGTQTLGSVLRPASYCGICGFKPTFGRLSMDGVLPFAPSLDTVGLFTRTASEMADLWSRGFGGKPSGEWRRALRFDETDPPEGWRELIEAALTINTYEGARTHEARFAEFGDRIGHRLAELVRAGLKMPQENYEAALAHVAHMKTVIAKIFEEYDVILTRASGPAPATLASTGDPSYNAPWTALGTPTISVPIEGSLVGLQITAAWNMDDVLVGQALWPARLTSPQS